MSVKFLGNLTLREHAQLEKLKLLFSDKNLKQLFKNGSFSKQLTTTIVTVAANEPPTVRLLRLLVQYQFY